MPPLEQEAKSVADTLHMLYVAPHNNCNNGHDASCCRRHPQPACHQPLPATHRTVNRASPVRQPPQPQTASVVQGEFTGCQLYQPSSRYVCDGGAAALAEGRAQQAWRAPWSNGSAYFVGDSLSLQHFHAFACALHADVPVPALAIAQNSSSCVRRRDGGHGRICHLDAGAAPSIASTSAALRTLARSRLLQKGDIVVANEGVWRRAFSSDPAEGMREELSRVRELDAATVREIREEAGAVLLWRETAAQHFDRSATGKYKTGCRSNRCGSCGPVLNASGLWTLNSLVNREMQALGVPVLPVLGHSLGAFREHVARRSQYVIEKGILDCTHYCEPSPLFARLTPLILEAVGA